jgi:serine/threonine protein kinase
MAPEVMEQVEGYDYKADIWSFGITALELAKGFAPYALHPPMKVLLLTIQEEPPSLRSYATEKSCTGESFSRSFKEMVRMCLQKEARKRPTVQTLMNCKFFKTKWPVGPLVNELLCHVGNISVMCRRFKLSNYFLQCIFFCCRYLMNPSPHKRVPCISRQMDAMKMTQLFSMRMRVAQGKPCGKARVKQRQWP